jgi:adenine deaminase
MRVARGIELADVVLKNGRVPNVFAGSFQDTDVAIKDGVIVGLGDYRGVKEINVSGCFVVPGFMDAHLHIESTLLSPSYLAHEIFDWGTTSIFVDPHEIANVAGLDGVTEFIEGSRNLPVDIFFGVPSCVPATRLSTSGGKLDAGNVGWLFGSHDEFISLSEVMDYQAVINGDSNVLNKIEMADGLPIDGHAPGLTGKDLNAYIAAGIGSDHECSTASEAVEKISKGMHIFLREGTVCNNLFDLSPLFKNPSVTPSLSLCCDDILPTDLVRRGHINHLVQVLCMEFKWKDIHRFIRAASLNTARYFGLDRVGAIAPGYRADIAVFEDFWFEDKPRLVLKNGKTKDEFYHKKPKPMSWFSVDFDLPDADFEILEAGNLIKVIDIVPGQVLTKKIEVEPKLVDHKVVSDPDRDITKIAVMNRHKGHSIGLGFVRGLGLKSGAIASTIAHDHHNLIVAGVNDFDMEFAAETLANEGGGLIAVCNGSTVGKVNLPIAGLMANETAKDMASHLQSILGACRKVLGIELEDPFMTLSFLGLEVIPDLKITDMGLVDVNKGEFVPLWTE